MKRTALPLVLLSLGLIAGCGGGGGGSNPLPILLPVTPDVVMAASNDNSALAFVASTTTGLAPASGSPFAVAQGTGLVPASVIFNPSRTFAYVDATTQSNSSFQSSITPFQVTGATVAPIAGATITQAGDFLGLGADPSGQFLFISDVTAVGSGQGSMLRSTINSNGTLTAPVVAAATLPVSNPLSVTVVQTSGAKVLLAGGFDQNSGNEVVSFTVDSSGNLTQESVLTGGSEVTSIAVASLNGSTVAYVVTAFSQAGPALQAVTVNPDGTLTRLGAPIVLSGQPVSAAVVTSAGHAFVYLAFSSATNNVIGFAINADGSVNPTIVTTASVGTGAQNAARSVLADPQGNPVLFASAGGTANNLTAFSVGANGALAPLGTLSQGSSPNLTPAASAFFF